MKKKLQCKQFRGVKKSTLEKESCNKLWERMNCYGGGHTKKINGKKVQQAIEMFMEQDPASDTPVGHAFRNTVDILSNRVCPSINTDRVVDMLKDEFPNHSFKIWRESVQIPHTFDENELERLKEKGDELSGIELFITL